jgi:hypothetical protein
MEKSGVSAPLGWAGAMGDPYQSNSVGSTL